MYDWTSPYDDYLELGLVLFALTYLVSCDCENPLLDYALLVTRVLTGFVLPVATVYLSEWGLGLYFT